MVAAFTISNLISNSRKTAVETRLKASYSNLSNAVKRATADYGDISVWEFDNLENFLNKYMLPYISNVKGQVSSINNWSSCKLELADGTFWEISNPSNFNLSQYDGYTSHNYLEVIVDINGDKKPNKSGYDIFYFNVLPYAANLYNTGEADIAINVQNPGVYYDGYGFSKNTIINNPYRGCSQDCSSSANYCRSYCTALIILNGWRIPNDYPFKF